MPPTCCAGRTSQHEGADIRQDAVNDCGDYQHGWERANGTKSAAQLYSGHQYAEQTAIRFS